MSKFEPKRILVTGGAGFIGSNFVRKVLAETPDVHVFTLDALTYAGSLANLEGIPSDRHHFTHGDICNGELVVSLLREHRIDSIVHLAAESHVDRSIQRPAPFIETNLVGTFTLLEAARTVWLDEEKLDSSRCLFHHVSTDEVFGALAEEEAAFDESSCYRPNSPYSASKAGSDHLVRAYWRTYGLPVTVSNCSNNYGPRQHREKFIPTIIRACAAGSPIPIYGDGRHMRDWLYVDDHCEALIRVLEEGRPGESYNIGGDNEHRNIEVAQKICALFDERYPSRAPHGRLITFVADRPGHDLRYSINNSKISAELAWLPRTQFGNGLSTTVEWFLRESASAAE